jgi:hypothetical protein
MMQLFKNCPSILIIYTKDFGQLMKNFKETFTLVGESSLKLNAEHKIKSVFNLSKENQTIVIITEKLRDFVNVSDIKEAMIIDEKLNNILVELINYPFLTKSIEKIRKGPDLITMKNYGDIEKFFESIKNDLKAHEGKTFDLLELNNKGTIITFTNYNISNHLSVNALYRKSLYTNYSKEEVINRIGNNGIKYINDSISKKGWNEYKIKIYDTYDQYNYHYTRLLYIIDLVNLGLVLNEGWGQDAGTLFKHVPVYELYLYTPMKPERVKEILVGSEYLETGERIVDLDLFYKKKKIKWSVLKTEDVYQKEAIGIKYRKELLSDFSQQEIEELKKIEEVIQKSK